MGLVNYINQLWKVQKRRQPSARRKRSTQLKIEMLEDRSMPSVVFHPYFGPESTNVGGGEKLNNTPVELIFWGSSYWNSPSGASAATIANSISTLLSSHAYDHLSQYGAGASPYLANWWIDTDHAGPNNPFTDSDLTNEIVNAINDPNAPIYPPSNFNATPLYIVITPFGTNVNEATIPERTRTTFGYHYDFNGSTNYGNFNLVYGWVGQPSNLGGLGGTLSNLDTITSVFSHESSEAMTDAQPFSGVTCQAPASLGGGGGEIGDFEPEWFNLDDYRVNGVLVQAMWDLNAGAFTVSDGNSQHMDLYASYSGSTYTGSTLDIYTDQLGLSVNTLTIDATGAGGVRVALNGEVFTFEPGIQITNINVFEGGGNDTVNVERTMSGVPVTIWEGGGTDKVNVSPSARFLDNIRGDVFVNGGSGTDTLNVTDQNDSFNDTWTVTGSTVTRSFSATIHYNWQNFINLWGGTGNLTYDVQGTEPSFTTTLYTGTDVNLGPSAFDTVNVQATSGTLNVLGQGQITHAKYVINVGQSGSVQNIWGTVNIENPPAYNIINIDDSADTTARTATLATFTPLGDSAWGSISGLAPAQINYEYGDTSAITIKTGHGGDVVNVWQTGVTTNLVGDSSTTVDIGYNHSVQGILGTLNIENPPSFTAIYIDDMADLSPHAATLQSFTPSGDSAWESLTGLAPAAINYEDFDTSSVSIWDGPATTINVVTTGGVATTVDSHSV
jgi:hypothetical protein